MKLFGNKKEMKACSCEKNSYSEVMQSIKNKKKENSIKVLGSGCIKCMELERNVELALETLQLDIKIDHVTDFVQIAGYGVMSTPALVFNDKVISYGKVLSADEIKALLEKSL